MVRQDRHERAFSRRRRRESCRRRYRSPCRRASAGSCIRATPGPFMLRQAQHEWGFAPGAHLWDLFGVSVKKHPKSKVRVFTLTPNSSACSIRSVGALVVLLGTPCMRPLPALPRFIPNTRVFLIREWLLYSGLAHANVMFASPHPPCKAHSCETFDASFTTLPCEAQKELASPKA